MFFFYTYFIEFFFFFLSLIYSCGLFRAFNITPEIIILFSGIYAYIYKQKNESVIIGIICAVLVGGLSGREFVFSALASIYYTAICFYVKPSAKPIFKLSAISTGYFFLLESLFYIFYCFNDITVYNALIWIIIPSALYNLLFCTVMYFAIKKAFTKKEKYIF